MQTIASWEDVDQALRRMGEIDIAVERANGDALLRINTIRAEAKSRTDGLGAERTALRRAVEAFCEERKDEFSRTRTRKMTFGEVGYRLVRSVSVPRAKDKVAALLKALRAYGCTECIQTEEKPLKEKLERLDDGLLAKLGLRRRVEDSFRVEPDTTAIQEDAA